MTDTKKPPQARVEGIHYDDSNLPEDLRPTPLSAEEELPMANYLDKLGFKSYDRPDGPAEYKAWVQDKLGLARCEQIEIQRQKRAMPGPNRYAEDVAFYEMFGDADAAHALQTMRHDYFLQTGPRVVPHLPKQGRIVDVGCCTGVLTNYYAQQLPQAELLGLDRVPAALKTARKDAQKFGLTNVSYDSADIFRLIPHKQVDAIVATTAFWSRIVFNQQQMQQYEAIEGLANRAKYLQASHSMRYNANVIHTMTHATKVGGTIIIMERLTDPANAEALRILHTLAGLEEKAFVPVVAFDEGIRQMFGMLVLERLAEIPKSPAVLDEVDAADQASGDEEE